MSSIVGIGGKPFVDLEPHLDLSGLDEVHDEVCLALAQVPVDYTGGSHRSMGIVPPSLRDEPWIDYGEVLKSLPEKEIATLRSLADDPRSFDLEELGEERSVQLSRRQMLWLKVRHGVYFPWKAYVELIPNQYWSDKANPAGKQWNRIARAYFAKTIAFVETLPFRAVGRCNVMGLESNDFGTVHHDTDPHDEPANFITLCPAKNKRLFLWDEERREKVHVLSRAYWFNDGDHHGVDPDPFFRYSIRVDGVFTEDFASRLRASR